MTLSAAGVPAADRWTSPALRERFVMALEHHDYALSSRIALLLGSCRDPLPETTCARLALPASSTYADAARSVRDHFLGTTDDA